jgi:hypothetical protein
MIQLKSKNSSFELTDRKRTLVFHGPDLELEDQTFNEPGEYEVEGIEIVYGAQAALVVWENIQIAYIFDSSKPAAFEKSQFTPCNVIVLAHNVTGITKPQLNELLETYDPNIAVASPDSISSELKSGYKFAQTDNVKLTAQSLPAEGRELYIIS